MSNLKILDYVILFVFVIAAYGIINILRIGFSQWLKWDVGEKEKVVQQRLTELAYECNKYKEEVADLRKQVKLILGQYDEAVIRGNDLREQYEQVKDEAKRLREEIARMDTDLRGPGDRVGDRILISAIGSKDRSFALDNASLYAVNTDTGMAFETIEATRDKLIETLDRARQKQNITYLHLSIKSDEQGYQLIDGIVDAQWLASVLQGVIIMVVAGSDSSTVGDLLGVVPYVITMNDKVLPRDAAIFTRNFWTSIGKGLGPRLALKAALSKSPARMSPYVTSHWSDAP